MFLKTGVVMMSLALVLAAATVAFATSRDGGYERPAPVSTIPPPTPEPAVQTTDEPEDYSQPWLDIPDPEPVPQPKQKQKPHLEPWPTREPKPDLRPETPKPRPDPEAKPASRPGPKPESQAPPAGTKHRNAPKRDGKVSRARHYDLPAWATMGLTIPALGIHDAPVRSSDSRAALDAGVVHLPETSLPWDEGSRKNVYLAGHRLGWSGTGSYHIFYLLPDLRRGDVIVLRGRKGRAYRYRVTEKLLVGPESRWVTKTAPGKDMLSLQTCTPIPTFQRRLIVRAERVQSSPEKRIH